MRYHADTETVSEEIHYERELPNIFFNYSLYEGYNDIIKLTSKGVCINNLVYITKMNLELFYTEVEKYFPEQIRIAEEWQDNEVPESLYYNHGIYLKNDDQRAIDYVVDRLRDNSTSSRAIMPLINVKMS